MEITKDNLEQIELLAYRYLKFEEISIVIGFDIKDNLEAEKAFLTGRLKRKAEFNGNIIQLSNQLSSPAMAIETKIASEIYLNDKLNESAREK